MQQPGGKEDTFQRLEGWLFVMLGDCKGYGGDGWTHRRQGVVPTHTYPGLADPDTSCVLDFDSRFGKEEKGKIAVGEMNSGAEG